MYAHSLSICNIINNYFKNISPNFKLFICSRKYDIFINIGTKFILIKFKNLIYDLS